ncbi:MAG: ECF transporter S component [Clostridium sp.]|uniref:CD3073 family putative ECF transporter S component n=1 Tax=Clostridium sp. TaxID=1506 RepID=UPI00302F35AB
MNKKFSSTTILMLAGLAIALNVVLGIITSSLKLPFYLDTIGTVFIAIYFGPWYGAAVGGLSNFLASILTNPQAIPFMLVSIVIGLVVGFVFRKIKFTFVSSLIIGIILSIVAPLIGTPIGVYVYGGLTGTVSDIAVVWIKQSGASIFTASFIPKVFNNLLDKIGTCMILYFVISALPAAFKPQSFRALNGSKSIEA